MRPSDKGQQEEDGHVAAAQMAPKHWPEDVDFNTSISKSAALLKGDLLIPLAGFLHLPPKKCSKKCCFFAVVFFTGQNLGLSNVRA